MIMYNYLDWLEVHSKSEELKKVTCPDVTLIGPKIFFKSPPTNKDEINKVFSTVIAATEVIIGLELFNIEHFCITQRLHKAPTTS